MQDNRMPGNIQDSGESLGELLNQHHRHNDDDGKHDELHFERNKVQVCPTLTNILLVLTGISGLFVVGAAIVMKLILHKQWFDCTLFNEGSSGILAVGMMSTFFTAAFMRFCTRGSFRGYKTPCGLKKRERGAHGRLDQEVSPKSRFLYRCLLPTLGNAGILLWMGILVVAGVLAILFAKWSKDLPSLTSDFTVSGRDGPIVLQRDQSGITHIYAKTQLDAVFGQGFAHGQDRLWQIEFQRLAYQGKLAEHLGAPAKKFDKQTRTLGFHKAAQMLCTNITDKEKPLMQAYVDGLNSYMSTNKNRPPEFLFMSKGLIGYHEPEPFQIIDICGAARLLQWKLSLNVNREIDRFKIFWDSDADYSTLENLYTNFTNISSPVLSAEDLDISEEMMVNQRAAERLSRDVEREMYTAEGFFGKLREQYNPSRSKGFKKSALISNMKRKMLEQGAVDEKNGEDIYQEDDEDDEVAGVAATKAVSDHHSSKVGELLGSVFGCGDPSTGDQQELDIVKFIRDHASNAWVGKGEGLDAKSCQASDPHLELNTPAIWYYSHLHWEQLSARTPANEKKKKPFDIAGVGMLGIPGVHIGKSSNVSWGITMSMTDLEDLFYIVPSPKQPHTHYMHNGQELAFTMRTEVIKVKGEAEPITLYIKETIYGPVATDALGLPRPDVLNFAVSARALQPDNSTVLSICNMINPEVDTAKKVRDMIFANMQSPGFSIPATDHTGEMVYTMTGSHIKRAFGHTGWVPTIGNGTYDWEYFIPFTELPTKVIPRRAEKGAISCANQKIYPDGYKYILGLDFAYPYRGKRLQELVNTSVTIPSNALSNLSYHVDVQTDIRSNMWVVLFKPLLSSPTGGVHHPNDGPQVPVQMPEPFTKHLTTQGTLWFETLMNWDGRSTKGSPEPTFFWFWYRTLGRYPTPAIESLKMHLWTSHQYPYRTLANPSPYTEEDCTAFYWADPSTSPSMKKLQNNTLENPCFWLAVDSWNMLAAQYPSNETIPKWGIDVNKIDAFNLMMHATPLKCMFDLKAGKDGDFTSIDVADPSTLHGNIPIIAASSMRQVYSWDSPNWIHFALPGGESGNPFSKWYNNMLQPYIDDIYQNVTVVGSLPEADVTSKQTLQ